MAKVKERKVGLRATSGNRTLAFGLVRVGVGMQPLIKAEKRIAGKMLDAEQHLPVKQVWQTAAGDTISRSDTVKGYAWGDGYVILEDGELPEAEGTDTITLTANVDEQDIPSVYVEKPYLLFPSAGQHDSYAVLLAYLRDNARVLIGQTVADGTTKAFAVRYSHVTETLVAELLTYEQNVRWAEVEQVKAFMAEVDEPTPEYVAAVDTIFAGLDDDFDWGAVSDTYGEALEQAVAQKAAGSAVTTTPVAQAPADTPDLMAALRATVEANKTEVAA